MRLVVCTVTVAVLAGCGRSSATVAPPAAVDAGVVHTSAATVEVDAGFTSAAAELGGAVVDAGAGLRPLAGPAVAGQKVDVPAGSFPSGSTPGDEGRVPSIEPALADVRLNAFAIDALPYPNDPARAPELVSSAAEASRLCSERGARLCTELEWERACKGPDSDRFATGTSWNPACDRSPSRCASGFGARAMGFVREWTDSRASFTSGRDEPAVVRGGPGAARRCAARTAASAKDMPGQMAFRCCHGARNDASMPAIEPKPPFHRTDLDAGALAKIFAQVPELARIRDGVRLFEASDVKAVVGRGAPRDGKGSGEKREDTNRAEGISFATQPISWSPEPGVELLVATGRAKKTGFVVALWILPEGKYRFASSFLFLDDPAPVVLAWEPSHRKELRWTTCWGCAGEQGAVSLRDDGRAVIVQY